MVAETLAGAKKPNYDKHKEESSSEESSGFLLSHKNFSSDLFCDFSFSPNMTDEQ